MVPTLMLVGLVLGRWWRTTLVAATLGWPILLLADGLIEPGWNIAAAAGLSAANTAAGIVVHQAIRWAVRRATTRDQRGEPERAAQSHSAPDDAG